MLQLTPSHAGPRYATALARLSIACNAAALQHMFQYCDGVKALSYLNCLGNLACEGKLPACREHEITAKQAISWCHMIFRTWSAVA